MEPAVVARLASAAVVPLVKRLVRRDGPGAGLVDRPVRVGAWLTLGGEKQTLGERDLRRLAEEVVERSARERGPYDALSAELRRELADALDTALYGLGDLDMDDVQAVRLGAAALAARLPRPAGLSGDARALLEPLLTAVCAHVLEFFASRSTFANRTLVEQSRDLAGLAADTALLLERTPSPLAEDARFEQRYAEHIGNRHGELTILGLGGGVSREWPLEAAYVPLEAASGVEPPAPVAQALAVRERVVLRGSAGAGKTTLLQWLALAAVGRGERPGPPGLYGRVPFLLPLRRVLAAGAPPTPDRFLHAVRSSLAGAQPDGWADRVLSAGRGLLLVDGVDEIPAEARETTRRWLRELVRDFPDNRWVVTARPSAVRDEWLADVGFHELSLVPLATGDVRELISRWHAAAGADPAAGRALYEAVLANPALAQLAVHPLLCALLCALNSTRDGRMPSVRRELYDAALGLLLERRDEERGVSVAGVSLDRDTRLGLLQRFAHWMTRNHQSEMAASDAVRQIRRALGDTAGEPEAVLEHLLSRSGLLRESTPGVVHFATHGSFQHFLAARAALEEGDLPMLLVNAHRPQWEDVVRMAVALGGPTEQTRLVEGLLPADGDGRHSPTAVRRGLLAASCLPDAAGLDDDARRRVLEFTAPLVPPRDKRAVRTLIDLGTPTALALLPGPEGLPDEVALNVVLVATRLGSEAALPLLARYRAHPSLAVRRQLAWSWYRFDTDRYAEEVISGLGGDGLYFTAHHTEHLRALRALGGRPRVQVADPDYRPSELLELLDRDRLTALWLPGGYRPAEDGGRWLHRFPRLTTLVLPERPPADDPTLPDHLTVTDRPD
ncbi:NACHT domain-containing protein [Streptomyces alkaliterrae]|uniref:NACHT domain-containing protein n=1 Tax=Streptomyces alkaliterrae TaxID=2213162 RepID=A0A7W3ZSD2_9ACTN|nr:NACHT domain-containing protein [Streptomyces alkaliterrae]MBB1258688.1 NACHT domain-containing protein [Streptomyces alkaliterrae]